MPSLVSFAIRFSVKFCSVFLSLHDECESFQPPRKLLMGHQLRTGGVEGLLASTSFPAALELLRLENELCSSSSFFFARAQT